MHRDDCTPLFTLADYLEGEGLEYAQLKFIPRVNWLGRTNGISVPEMHACAPITHSDSNSLTKTITSSDEMSDSSANGTKLNGDPMDYLFQRRKFLRSVLIERYAELFHLMQLEMDLTGQSPELYEQYSCEYHALLSTIPTSMNHRNEETGKAQLERQTSYNGTAKRTASGHSRTECMGNQDSSYLAGPTPRSKSPYGLNGSLASLASENPLDPHAQVVHRSLSKTSVHSLETSQTTKLKVSKFMQRIGRAKQSKSPVYSNNADAQKLQSVSLADLRISCANGANDARSKDNRTPNTGAVESRVEQDQLDAIEAIDMELGALQNIMDVNTRCGNELWRTKATRKAYKMAAAKNKHSIQQLQAQRQKILSETLFRSPSSNQPPPTSPANHDSEQRISPTMDCNEHVTSTCWQTAASDDLSSPTSPDIQHFDIDSDSALTSSGVYEGLSCTIPNIDDDQPMTPLVCDPRDCCLETRIDANRCETESLGVFTHPAENLVFLASVPSLGHGTNQ